MSSPSLLQQLRSYGAIACDSLDINVAREFGPFAGATSNQFIVLFELTKDPDTCAELLHKATQHAVKVESDPEKRVSASVKLIMILLVQRMLPYLVPDAKVFIQASMKSAWSTEGTLNDAREIVALARSLPDGGEALASRICVKIPSTYEALQATPALMRDYHIPTLGTALFSLEQAALASQFGCAFISPYVNELRMHFNKDEVDQDKLFNVTRDIWRYYRAKDVQSKTVLMPASFIVPDDILAFTGVDALTIPAHFISAFAEVPPVGTSSSPLKPNYSREQTPTFTTTSEPRFAELAGLAGDEARYQALFAKNTHAVRKLNEAIATFFEFEEKLEDLVRLELQKSVSK